MKSAILEREAGDVAAERGLLAEGLARFPYSWKMHLMTGQLEEREGEGPGERQGCSGGVVHAGRAEPMHAA